MNEVYKELSFSPVTAEQSDTLVALLSSIGFDGFEILKEKLNAYIPISKFDVIELTEVLNLFPGVQHKSVEIEEQNWNAIWESSFEPVIVNEFVAVRAAFHAEQPQVKHDIIITPKMSFGTGHHATTALVIGLMEEINFKNKRVVDFGTGTGVLAILAEQLGATKIMAIDNDKWSIENAKENFELNNTHHIELKKLESLAEVDQTDIILANINLNVLKANMDHFSRILGEGGEILFSGLLVNDQQHFLKIISEMGFVLKKLNSNEGWIAIHCSFAVE